MYQQRLKALESDLEAEKSRADRDAEALIAEDARSQGISVPAYRKKYGFPTERRDMETPVPAFGDTQVPIVPESESDSDPIDPEKARAEYEMLQREGLLDDYGTGGS